MRLIDADSLDAKVYNDVPISVFGSIKKMAAVRQIIEDAPSIDAVPVIRCKNCLNYVEKGNGYGECQFLKCKKSAQGYCDYGIDRI